MSVKLDAYSQFENRGVINTQIKGQFISNYLLKLGQTRLGCIQRRGEMDTETWKNIM